MKKRFSSILAIVLTFTMLLPSVFSFITLGETDASGYTGNLVYADNAIFDHDKTVILDPARSGKYIAVVTDDDYIRMREIEVYDQNGTKLTLNNGIISIEGISYSEGAYNTGTISGSSQVSDLLDANTVKHHDYWNSEWWAMTSFLLTLEDGISVSKIIVYTGIYNDSEYKHAVKIYISESSDNIFVGSGSEPTQSADNTLMLEDFSNFTDFSVLHPAADGYAPPTLEITDTGTDQGDALLVNWASTETLKSYVHKFEPTADWAKKTFAENAESYTYFRLWVNNPTFVQIELTVRLYSSSTKVYMNADSAIVSRKDGTKISHVNGNATGTGANSSITIPSAFSGWVAYPISLEHTTGATGRVNITDFSEVNTIQIDVRRPETYDTGTYYILDDICLSTSAVGTLQSTSGSGDDYETAEKEPIDTELKNVIVLVGDGMGQTILQAARDQKGAALNVDSMWYKSTAVSTNNIYEQLTDSAAAGTALSCGIRTANSYIAVDTTGAPIENMVEFFSRAGKKTGIVTTSYLLDATPTTYGSHGMRNDYATLADGMFKNDISVLIGGGKDYFNSNITYNEQTYSLLEYAQSVYDYTYVDTADSLDAFSGEKVLGLFGSNYMDYETDRNSQPSIATLTEKAIALLENGNEGFFLMVEGGNIDHAAHNNDLNRTVTDTLAFDDAVKVALDYMAQNPDTLVVVCADHSTGGLTPSGSGYSFTTNNHDQSVTACFASGLGSRYFADITENAHIAQAIHQATLKAKSVETTGTTEITYYNELSDLNQDGELNIIDLVRYKKLIVLALSTNKQPDLDRDGYINSNDIALMRRFLLGIYS